MTTQPAHWRKFSGGNLVITVGVNEELASSIEFSKFMLKCLGRHLSGDWGEMSDKDKQENNSSLDKHLRLLSSYETKGLPKIWIITEADRSRTTVLFADEY